MFFKAIFVRPSVPGGPAGPSYNNDNNNDNRINQPFKKYVFFEEVSAKTLNNRRGG